MRPLTPKERAIIKEESAFVQICLAVLEDKRVVEIADKARLSTTTIYNLRKGARPATHALTLRKLGMAAGLSLVWVEDKARIKTHKKGRAA